MGVLYAVSGRDPGFPLLMKVPRLGPGEPGEAVLTYEMEQTVLGALRGPHVPRLVAAGDVAEQPYLVMERVEGRSLKEWSDRAPLPAAEVARLGAAVATALHALHEQEAVHLDLKPSNVLLRPTGQAVLIDLGLAAHAHYPDLLAEELRRPIGSAPFISPEQVLGIRGDPRSDVFALGVILYELATGQLPFGAPTSPAGLRKRLFRDPVPPRALQPTVPPWLQEVVLRCLEPDARARYASAAQVAFDLVHPDQVALTERAGRLRRRAGLRELLRWLRAAGLEPTPPATGTRRSSRRSARWCPGSWRSGARPASPAPPSSAPLRSWGARPRRRRASNASSTSCCCATGPGRCASRLAASRSTSSRPRIPRRRSSTTPA